MNTLSASHSSASPPPVYRAGGGLALFLGFTLYIVCTATIGVVYPLMGVALIAPLAFAVLILLPVGRGVSRALLSRLVIIGGITLALWPVYVHVKLGPLPILTPPRLILYFATFVWVLDMARAPLRRAQFVQSLLARPVIAMGATAMVILGAMSLPLAEGRSIAGPAYFRELIIWFLPCAVAATYIRTDRDLERLIKGLVIVAGILGCVALAEKGTQTLLASILSPFMADSAWLNTVQSDKIRDGVFRAQAVFTHPIGLGEYMSIMAPFAVAFALQATTARGRALWVAMIVLIALGAYATSSRAATMAFGMSAIILVILLIARFMRNAPHSPLRPLFGLIAALVFLASPVIAIGGYKLTTGSGGGSSANSSQARIEQIELALPKLAKRPLFGYGTSRAAPILGYFGRGLSIDNYYLSLALDLGLLGPVAFILMLTAMFLRSLERARAGPARYQMLYLGFAGSTAAFMTCRAVSSLTGTLGISYLMIGAFIGAGAAHAVRRRKKNRSLPAA